MTEPKYSTSITLNQEEFEKQEKLLKDKPHLTKKAVYMKGIESLSEKKISKDE